MSSICISRVLHYSRQSGSAKLLLTALADHADDDGTGAAPSIAALARTIGTGVRNVQLLLRKLEHSGELECAVGAGPNGCNRYTIHVARDTDQRITQEQAAAPGVIVDTAPTGEAEIAHLRKEGKKEGGSAPTAQRNGPVPAAPAGEPALPAGPFGLWRAARGEAGHFQEHQLQALALAHDASTAGFGHYWLARGILAAAETDQAFATNPRALNLVRAILARWQADGTYGSDTPRYHKEQQHDRANRTAERSGPVRQRSTSRSLEPANGQLADARPATSCTIVGFPSDGG